MYNNKENWKSVKYFNEYAIWYMLSGSLKIQMDDNEYIVNEGDVVFFYPNKVVSCVSLNSDFFLRSIHFDFCFENDIHFLELINMAQVYPAEIFKKESSVFNEIFRNRKYDEELSGVIIKGYILIILGNIFKHYNEVIRPHNRMSEFSKNDLNRFEEILNYIYNNLDKKITVTDLAHIAGFSKNYFSDYFKKVFGISIQHFIYRARMIKAKEYIVVNKYPLKRTAYLLGYDDQNAFSKAFKRYHKIPPSVISEKDKLFVLENEI
jgi:AraC family transcriptional regulator